MYENMHKRFFVTSKIVSEICARVTVHFVKKESVILDYDMAITFI